MSATEPDRAPLIAILAGEDSGDQLGADLIIALRQRYPQARFVGIGGARMQREGFESWYDIHELSLFGFSEVVSHLPRLLRLRKALVARLLEAKPAVVIGIDAPDFNLGVEQRLKQAGLPTVHYVSPSVWAWREKRAEKIGRSASLVLCLFPMEPAIYAKHGIDAASSAIHWPTVSRWCPTASARAISCNCRNRRRCSPCCLAAGCPKWLGWAGSSLKRQAASLPCCRGCAS
jgi:lipid-A-disaccharide synthase